MVVAFLTVYGVALPFLILVSIFVHCVLHDKDCNLCSKLDDATRRRLFQSTATTTWILLLINSIVLIIFMITDRESKKPEFPPLFDGTNDDLYYHSISVYMPWVVRYHKLIIVVPTIFLFIFFLPTFCIGGSIRAKGGGNRPDDAERGAIGEERNERNNSKYCSVTSVSIVAMIFFAFTFLWDFIPLIPHLIVFPYHTLSIVVQYVCVLFLVHCFMYHLLKCFFCSEYENRGCCEGAFSEFIETVCEQFDFKPHGHHTSNCNCCGCRVTWNFGCTWRTCCQILLMMASCLFLTALGFLYLVAVNMGVSTAAVTISALTAVSAIVIATATDAVKCIYNKTVEVLDCNRERTANCPNPEQPPEQPAEQPPEQPPLRPLEEPPEQPPEQPAEQPPEQPLHQPPE